MLYYTQFIGDANNLPVILGLPNFRGIGLLDSDPYLAYGFSWWANQVGQPVLQVTDYRADTLCYRTTCGGKSAILFWTFDRLPPV
jgi:hypothetical protein